MFIPEDPLQAARTQPTPDLRDIECPPDPDIVDRAIAAERVPLEAIGMLLAQAMDQAVRNGANSVSMPDEYVEIAAWLAATPPAQPEPPQGYKLLEDSKTAIPADWTPLRMEWEPGYPEDVAFGPQRAMDRLKKWLDAYFVMIQQRMDGEAQPAPVVPATQAYAALIEAAAELANRKPIRALAELSEVTHIGHRQFARAYEPADDALAVLSIKIRAAADALLKLAAPQPLPLPLPNVELSGPQGSA